MTPFRPSDTFPGEYKYPHLSPIIHSLIFHSLFSLAGATTLFFLRTMALKSFIEVRPDSHFPIQNLPYGVFKPAPNSAPRPGVAIGDYVLDISEIASAGLFDGPILNNSSDVFHQVFVCLILS